MERLSLASSSGDVSFEAAPKQRFRPKAKPKAEAKTRGRPPKPDEPVLETLAESAVPPEIDVSAFLDPLAQAYMATTYIRLEQFKKPRYEQMFQNMKNLRT